MNTARRLFHIVLAAACLLAGRAWAGECDEDPTISPYIKALKADSKNLETQFNLAVALYSKVTKTQGESPCVDDAIDAAKRFIKSASGKNPPKDMMSTAYSALGILQFQFKNDIENGVDSLKKVLEYNPTDKDSLYAVAVGYKKMGKDDLAIEYFKKTVAVDASNLNAFFSLAVMLNTKYGQDLDREKDKEKIADLKKAFEGTVAVAAKDRKANAEVLIQSYNRLGELYDLNGEGPKAIGAYEKSIKLVSKADEADEGLKASLVTAHAKLGILYSREKNYLKMVEEYEQVIALDPNSEIARYNLGAAYVNQEQNAKAYRQFAYITDKINPSNPEVLALQAQTLEKALGELMTEGGNALAAEDFLKAKQNFEEVLALNPKDAAAKGFLADAEKALESKFKEYMAQAKKEAGKSKIKAAEAVEKALALKPNEHDALDLKKKIGADIGQLVNVFIKRGDKYMKEKNYVSAEDEYKKALAIPAGKKIAETKLASLTSKFKGEFDSYMKMAKSSAAKGDLAKARASYRGALSIKGSDKVAAAGLVEINRKISDKIKKSKENGEKYFGEGDKAKAKKEFEAVLALDPNDNAANDFIKRITGTESKARVSADQVKKLYYEGVDHYVNNRIDKAIKTWENLLSMDPNHLDAKKNIDRARTKLAALKKLQG